MLRWGSFNTRLLSSSEKIVYSKQQLHVVPTAEKGIMKYTLQWLSQELKTLRRDRCDKVRTWKSCDETFAILFLHKLLLSPLLLLQLSLSFYSTSVFSDSWIDSYSPSQSGISEILHCLHIFKLLQDTPQRLQYQGNFHAYWYSYRPF